MSARTVKTSPLTENTTKNVFGNNLVKGVGEGDIDVAVKCGGKTTKI